MGSRELRKLHAMKGSMRITPEGVLVVTLGTQTKREKSVCPEAFRLPVVWDCHRQDSCWHFANFKPSSVKLVLARLDDSHSHGNSQTAKFVRGLRKAAVMGSSVSDISLRVGPGKSSP